MSCRPRSRRRTDRELRSVDWSFCGFAQRGSTRHWATCTWIMIRLSRRLAVAASVVALFVAPRSARAHAHLTGSSPSAGARLSAVPRELRLEFTEAPELAGSSIGLFAADGKAV